MIRAYRHHPYHGRQPLPQATVAGWFGVTQAQLSRVETGPPMVHLDRLAQWARVMGIPAHILWFRLPPGRDNVPPPVAGEAGPHLLSALRCADRQIGGRNLYRAALAHISAFSQPPGQSSALPRPMLLAGASLHEMAGWMAHDSGDSATGRQHFRDALALAVDSGDHLLVGQIQGSLSHLASHDGNAEAALSHAVAGLHEIADKEGGTRVRARLFALQARGFAASGRATDCHSSLPLAETALAQVAASPAAWLSPFDHISLDIERARCLLRLGDVTAALQVLDDIVTDEPTPRVRSQALARTLLVTALVGQARVEEACLVTHQTIDLTHGLGSAVVLDQLRHLALLLRSHSVHLPDVPQLLDRLRDTFRERSWMAVPLPMG
ncbi:helix-turn-helix transcriptional regulator [Micromonospora schwarzwaldensis]|uniref:helix-turn-helix transcriptional regulator n=1 Tax=Micromonospora sp. DSM 45708 TaxID=3111767 RepID=UPI0031D76942